MRGLLDNLMPKEVALQAEDAGVIKANLDVFSTVMLAVLAGAFIGFGAVFSTTVLTGNGLDGAIKLPFGLMRLLGGSVFCLGLILVTIAGAEMFTGNVLLVMAAASRKISARRLLRNWGIVFGGNFVGAAATAYLIFLSGQYRLMDGQVGLTALRIAEAKCELNFVEALTRAIFCNILVCLAIWLSLSGRTVIDKIAVILFPITAFVTSGFEHSVANMYFISFGLFVKEQAGPQFWQMAGASADHFAALHWRQFLLGNLVPVTLGNTLGGLVVGLMYWGIYCRPNILMRYDDRELLRQLIKDGGRLSKQIECGGKVALIFQGRTFHGKLRSLGSVGLMGEFYEASGLPAMGYAVILDVELDGRPAPFSGLHGKVVDTLHGKNLMGRDYMTCRVRFAEDAPEIKDALRAAQ